MITSGSGLSSGIMLFGMSIALLHGIAAFKSKKPTFLSSVVTRLSCCASGPPQAIKVLDKIAFGKHATEYRGKEAMDPPVFRDDHFNWLRDETRKKKEVLDHLIAENNYMENSTVHLKPLQDTLYNEMLSHLKETDAEVPYKNGPYYYYTKTQEGTDQRSDQITSDQQTTF